MFDTAVNGFVAFWKVVRCVQCSDVFVCRFERLAPAVGQAHLLAQVYEFLS